MNIRKLLALALLLGLLIPVASAAPLAGPCALSPFSVGWPLPSSAAAWR